ncbi:DUF6685 family protein [Pseudomonas atacamensis]|uniref:DUF6685 family protein n=1 Tax=Pseudomonas iranensis TaxID=2745503 RepID=A0AAU7F0X2_9PSED
MIKAAAQFVVGAIQEEFGHPSSLVKLIANEPGLNKPLVEYEKGISSEEVVKWHEFGNLSYERSRPSKGSLNGFGYCLGAHRNYGGVSVRRDDLLNLGTTREVERWECDIQDVAGFSASKSELHLFKSMDAMVEKNSKEMIDEITPEKLAENLAWDEIRIISRVDHDFFQTFSWDGRVFLMNSGGSHHFAASKYIAKRLNTEVPLSGRYRVHGINRVALESLTRDFEIFVMSSHHTHQMGFHRAMQSFKATYYWKNLPRPYTEQCAVFLPKAERKSAKVAEILHASAFQDLGCYLKDISTR